MTIGLNPYHELDPCITINNVLPGFTDTERLMKVWLIRFMKELVKVSRKPQFMDESSAYW